MPAIYFVLAGAFLAVLLVCFLKGGMTLSTCAGWVVLTCIHGLIFKPLFVYLDFPSAELLDLMLFQKVSRAEYWRWGTVALFGYIIFFAAMIVAGRYHHRSATTLGASRVRCFSVPALAMFFVLACAGMVGFFIQFPQLLESLNKNAVASMDLADYNGGGIWRSLIQFSYLISLCSLVNIGAGISRRSAVALFAASSGLWLVFCYLSDQRGAILFSVVTYLVAYNRYVSRLSWKAAFSAVTVAFVLVVAKTVARLQTGGAALQENFANTIGNFVGQNFIEHSKTIAIIKAIPEALDFQYGFTYLNALLVLVPRSLFPAKSSVNLDTTIANQIFDCDAFGACGVPPGLLAESYLNFGVFGLMLMPIVLGLCIGRIDATFRRSERGGWFDMLYLSSLLYLGMAFLGSGISSSITSLITQGVAVALVCSVCGRVRSGSTSRIVRGIFVRPAATPAG